MSGRGRAVWVAGGLLLVAAVVAVIAVVMGSGDSSESAGGGERDGGPSRREVVEVARLAGVSSPMRPVLPPVQDQPAVVGFMEGEGSDLVDVHSLLRGLLRSEAPDEGDCLGRAGRLDDLLDPAGLYGLAGDIPDAVTSELFVDMAASTNRFLAACSEGDEVLRGELAYQWVLVDRRLEELGMGS